MIHSLSELDAVARRLAAVIPAADELCEADIAELLTIRRKFVTGRYGRDWSFARWLREQVGLDGLTVRSVLMAIDSVDDE